MLLLADDLGNLYMLHDEWTGFSSFTSVADCFIEIFRSTPSDLENWTYLRKGQVPPGYLSD